MINYLLISFVNNNNGHRVRERSRGRTISPRFKCSGGWFSRYAFVTEIPSCITRGLSGITERRYAIHPIQPRLTGWLVGGACGRGGFVLNRCPALGAIPILPFNARHNSASGVPLFREAGVVAQTEEGQ